MLMAVIFVPKPIDMLMAVIFVTKLDYMVMAVMFVPKPIVIGNGCYVCS